ncbi:hypothetical protein ACKVV1_004966 [Pyricularia oryzae]
MYLTGQHNVVPDISELRHVTHVALAFMQSPIFNEDSRKEWPLFTSVETVRRQFLPGTKVMIAIGGWGDVAGFETAAASAESRKRFAANVARMVEATGADGIDLDWEYPGGNGEDYKKVPNKQREWEIEAYPLLVAEVRSAIGPDKVLSAAVPGLERDLIAFTRETVPRILRHLDFLNVMTYDLMNRRDNVTKHHTGVQLSLDSIDAYMARGARPSQLNLGFAFYVKYFQTRHAECSGPGKAIGCPTLLLEDPDTGGDLGRTGGFSWHDTVPKDVEASFQKALRNGVYDEIGGGFYYWDEEEDRWWSFDDAGAISRKFDSIFAAKNLGGVFAWGLGEDAPHFEHLGAVNSRLDAITKSGAGRPETEL